MATIFARRPLLTTATTLSVAASAYYITRPRPLLLDSASNAATPTLSFPKTMLFSKQLTLTSVEQINHDTKKLTFALPGGQKEVSGVTPGGAILTQHTPSGAWFPVFRPYTPIHDLDERGVLQLLVKKYPNGKASSHIHSLAPGDQLTVRGPIPGNAWTTPAQQKDVLLIAGGAGITPIYSLTKGILSNPADKTRIQLLWGVNGPRDIVLQTELDALEKQYPGRLEVTYAVSGPDAESVVDGGKFRKGYVDQSLLAEAMEKCRRGGAFGDEKGKKVFLCGPPKMEDALVGKQGVLQALGLQKKEIHRF
ncbi:cytochrome-b5 reductase [Neohortaea acidophila]|uniref:NADH-cytochrome b5 reductase 2 n=1 Tax=Neohortaea acidophila TaxID=245834 RepID=A0A6A6PKG4_9PEZI|nr:cytochrome-b5 reductase [Neohortaea acidophila]KAF2480509.1 cytochrome-b5 reductase [Neohortaea acidophila]